MENERFKLITRRYLGWGVGGSAVLIICFVAVWGTITGVIELVTLSVGILATSLGSVIAFYFGKKASEE